MVVETTGERMNSEFKPNFITMEKYVQMSPDNYDFLEHIKKEYAAGKLEKTEYKELLMQSISDIRQKKLSSFAYAGSIVAAYFGASASIYLNTKISEPIFLISVIGGLIGLLIIVFIAVKIVEREFKQSKKEIFSIVGEIEEITMRRDGS